MGGRPVRFFQKHFIAAALCAALFAVSFGAGSWHAPEPSADAVLGTGDALADLVLSSYTRPDEHKTKRPSAGPKLNARQSAPDPGPASFADGYRTVCVRLCDGYFYPISSSTTPQNFARDESVCQNGCTSPSKLFVFKIREGSPATMVDREGKPYSGLETAFKFRASYNPACECKPKPWSEEAANAHRIYALEERKAKGEENVDRELTILKSVVTEQNRQARMRSGAAPLVSVSTRQAEVQPVRKAMSSRAPVVRTAVRTTRTEQRAGLARAHPRERIATGTAPILRVVRVAARQ